MGRIQEWWRAPLFCFVRYEVRRQFGRARWLLLLAAMAFLSYMMSDETLVQAANLSLRANAWDAMFRIFGNQNPIFGMLAPIYLYLISDLAVEPAFGQMLLLRLGSRRLWRRGKVITLGLAVALYLLIAIGVAVLFASLTLPWESGWSQAAQQFPVEFYINPGALNLPPALAFGALLGLLALGWFCLGLLTFAVTQRSGHAMAGFGISSLVAWGSYGALIGNLPPPFSYLFIHYHLMFNYHAFDQTEHLYPSLIVSLAYWALWVILLREWISRISRSQDFLFQRRSD